MSISPVQKRNRKVIPKKNREETNTFVYKLTTFDSKGWANAEKFKPIPYDMLLMKTNHDRVIHGWWAEFFYDGFRLKPGEKVIKWKKCPSQWGWD